MLKIVKDLSIYPVSPGLSPEEDQISSIPKILSEIEAQKLSIVPKNV